MTAFFLGFACSDLTLETFFGDFIPSLCFVDSLLLIVFIVLDEVQRGVIL
jgi:hypothetical protein